MLCLDWRTRVHFAATRSGCMSQVHVEMSTSSAPAFAYVFPCERATASPDQVQDAEGTCGDTSIPPGVMDIDATRTDIAVLRVVFAFREHSSWLL